jgi:muramoyltetrapeptide carboxypeptidase
MILHLIAPSGCLPDPAVVDQGIAWLKGKGVNVQNISCTQRQFQRFAGTDIERLEDINALAHLSNTVVMSLRGGYGLSRLMNDIQWQAIGNQVKKGLQIVGHSDFTVFNLGLFAKTGAPSFAGPMFSYDFGGDVSSFTWKHFNQAVAHNILEIEVLSPQKIERPIGIGLSDQAVLWGGNLTMLTSLLGTNYMPSHEQVKGGILFLEDVNEHPYRVERMLHQLIDAGYLANQKAILMGDISAYKLSETDRGYDLDQALNAISHRLDGQVPVLTDLPFGHCADKLTLPIGRFASLSASQTGYILKSNW